MVFGGETMIPISTNKIYATRKCIFRLADAGYIGVTITTATLFSTADIIANGLVHGTAPRATPDQKTNEWQA